MSDERTPTLSPLKVAFRAEGAWVIASVAATDGSWFEEIGRMSRGICDDRHDLWLQFKSTMQAAGFYLIESVTDSKITSHEELPPELLEGPPGGDS